MDRSELIWIMAEAAWTAHYCPHNGNQAECENCKDDGECFELSGGFDRDDEWDWWNTARGALEAMEAALKISILPERQPPAPTSDDRSVGRTDSEIA